jgi:hypothetical protein
MSDSGFAQTASLRGQITDESGAVIPAAKVTLNGPSKLVRITAAAVDGSYSFVGLAPGDYTVLASAPELGLAQPAKITLKSGSQTLNLQLRVASTAQQVTVEAEAAATVSTDAASNASALVMRGADLDALSDNPDDLQADLLALAGPAAGPGGGAIFIDGFSGGQLPSKESIREIRINANPFSPEYDKLGYGRIEIFTKPGTDKFHGTGYFNFGDSFWNSRNPYAGQKAPFMLKEYGGSVSGPLNKRASFFLDVRRDSVDNGAIIHGITLDPQTLGIINPYTNVFQIPQRRVSLSPRVDYQLSPNNTLILRYGFLRADLRDAGIGSFNLVERGYHVQNTEEHVQISDTAVLGSSVVNEARFQFIRFDSSTIANSMSPAILVAGSFNGGGAQLGHAANVENDYEFQDYVSIARGAHSVKFGARLRGATVDNTSPQNFTGTFNFGGGLGPVLDVNNQPVPDASGQPVLTTIQSIEQYRRTLLFLQMGLPAAQIRALGGGATQFSINSGVPVISGSQVDVGVFAGDDWRARSNLTLSFGLRYETQSNIHDWRDVAPRVGIAWAPGAKNARPKMVVRAGFGTFYDRFSLLNTLAAQRYNGVVQQQYVVTNPDFFPMIPSLASLAGFQSVRTVQEISSTLRAPYMLQSAIGVERQLPFKTTVTLTYANSHGLHLLRSRDINAPLPGTYNPSMAGSGVFPLGSANPLFLTESSGVYNQNQLISSMNAKVTTNVSLFAYYMLNRARSNTDGMGTFPANPYSAIGEYGPANTDVRNHLSVSGSILTKWNFRFSPYVVMDSGPPFDITAGRDLYGDTLFNGRPGIATDPHKPGLIATRYGLLDPNPTLDEKILSRNFGRGPGQISMNLRVAKTIAFGPSIERAEAAWTGPGSGAGRRDTGGAFGMGAAGPSSTVVNHRFNLSISMSVRNLLNHTNPGPIIGAITSPLFGQSNQAASGGGGGGPGGGGFTESANNRRLELQMRLSF